MAGWNEESVDSEAVMNLVSIGSIEDPRLDPYRNLRTTNLTRFSGRFIAESRPLVQRLLASQLEVESILVDQEDLPQAIPWLPSDVPILVIPHELVAALIGFDFHRGFMACGIRPPMPKWEPQEHWNDRGCTSEWNAVMLVGVQDPENMGSIFRSCAALGIRDVVLGPNCVDPFARRVLRVSMGNAFKLSFYRTEQVADTLKSASQVGIESLAACLSAKSIELTQYRRSGPTLVLFGNEAHGLPEECIELCSKGIRIDMAMGTDSLNVSVAAGILLHYVCRIADQ
jgi:tRNA G18 (ribose-2'-O)-methylase SpoU